MSKDQETARSDGKIVERKGDKSKHSQTSVSGHFVSHSEPTDKSKVSTTKATAKAKK